MFCLHYSRDNKPFATDGADVLAALNPFGPAEAQEHGQAPGLRSFQVLDRNTSEPISALCACPTRGTLVFAWARLDNRLELADRLGLAAGQVDGFDAAQLILQAWNRWGEECCGQLVGDFAFAVYEPQSRRLFCARDHLGVRPFYYHVNREEVVVATCLPPLLQAMTGKAEPDPEWLCRYLTDTSQDFVATAWRDVAKLPPGSQLVIDRQGVRCRSWFEMHELAGVATRSGRPRDHLEAYRSALDAAIRCRLAGDGPVGSELSGGLDSASITCLAARELDPRGRDLHVFSFAAFEKEPEFAAAVCRQWQLQQRHRISRFSTLPLETELERAPLLLGAPTEHASASFHEGFYRQAAAAGVRILLSGFGGDEFVTNPAGLGLVATELLNQHRYLELWHRLPGSPLGRLRRMVRLLRQRQSPVPVPRREQICRQFRNRWQQQLVRPEIARRLGLEERYFAPLRFDSDYDSLRDYILDARWQPGVPTRLENCSLMAVSHGLEYRWPLLDIRLIRLFLSLPAELTYERGLDRNLHRQAVSGLVPEIILRQPGKDVGPPRPIPDHVRDLCAWQQEENLHPLIVDLIDLEAYRDQCRQLQKGFRALGMERWLLFWRNVHAVSQAHAWLKRWYPTG